MESLYIAILVVVIAFAGYFIALAFVIKRELNGEQRKGECDMASSEQINNTSYYQLPCGRYLEDFIYARKLNFNMGSALKYKWRAGHKDGESEEKDTKKANHYIEFETRCRINAYGIGGNVEREIGELIQEAISWNGK